MLVVVMPFGKYRGQYLAEVPTDYLKWVRKLPDLSSDLRRAVNEELDARPPEPRRFVVEPLPSPQSPPYPVLMRALSVWIEGELEAERDPAIRARLLDAWQRLMVQLSEQYGLIPPEPNTQCDG